MKYIHQSIPSDVWELGILFFDCEGERREEAKKGKGEKNSRGR